MDSFRARLAILSALMLFAAPRTVLAQPYPADGSLGVFFDRAGTQFCAGVPPVGVSTLYILASLAGTTHDGITGAEFRLEVSLNSGYFLVYAAAPGNCDPACVTPLDVTPCLGDAAGTNLAFPRCMTSDEIAGPGRVFLGSITVIHVGGGTGFTIETKRKIPATDPLFLCPGFVLCDAPAFTKVCMTWQEGDPALGGQEPVAFRTVVGSANCSSPPGCVVGVESQTWSTVKHLYRD